MAQACRERLSDDDLSPATRVRFEGALSALEALLGEPPSLLGDRADEFHLP